VRGLEGPGAGGEEVFACRGVFGEGDRAAEGAGGAVALGSEVLGVVCEADC
jgi:hypothetical protein